MSDRPNKSKEKKWSPALIIAGSIVLAALLAVSWLVGTALISANEDEQGVKNSETNTSVKYKPVTRDELFGLVNKEREKVGVAPLAMDERLNQSAQWMADDMVTRDYYAHSDPSTGKSLGLDKARELTGTDCRSISENQNKGGGEFSQSESILMGWMKSESHRNALLNPKYGSAGIGIAKYNDGQYIAIQHFCEASSVVPIVSSGTSRADQANIDSLYAQASEAGARSAEISRQAESERQRQASEDLIRQQAQQQARAEQEEVARQQAARTAANARNDRISACVRQAQSTIPSGSSRDYAVQSCYSIQ